MLRLFNHLTSLILIMNSSHLLFHQGRQLAWKWCSTIFPLPHKVAPRKRKNVQPPVDKARSAVVATREQMYNLAVSQSSRNPRLLRSDSMAAASELSSLSSSSSPHPSKKDDIKSMYPTSTSSSSSEISHPSSWSISKRHKPTIECNSALDAVGECLQGLHLKQHMIVVFTSASSESINAVRALLSGADSPNHHLCFCFAETVNLSIPDGAAHGLLLVAVPNGSPLPSPLDVSYIDLIRNQSTPKLELSIITVASTVWSPPSAQHMNMQAAMVNPRLVDSSAPSSSSVSPSSNIASSAAAPSSSSLSPLLSPPPTIIASSAAAASSSSLSPIASSFLALPPISPRTARPPLSPRAFRHASSLHFASVDMMTATFLALSKTQLTFTVDVDEHHDEPIREVIFRATATGSWIHKTDPEIIDGRLHIRFSKKGRMTAEQSKARVVRVMKEIKEKQKKLEEMPKREK